MLAELINGRRLDRRRRHRGQDDCHAHGRPHPRGGRLDPTVLVGDGASARAAALGWLVAETDESDGSLTLHHPQRAIVTNIELDHPDHFRGRERRPRSVPVVHRRDSRDGLAVVCADDELARELTPRARRVTYGFRTARPTAREPVRPFPLHHGGDELGRINLRQPGRHNIQNATAAAAMALELGVGLRRARPRSSRFPAPIGAWSSSGHLQGAAIYDDYAHHPTKVRATIDAARELRHRRLIVVFQPHRYSRLAALLRRLRGAFAGADKVLVPDVYARRRGRTRSGVQAADLARPDAAARLRRRFRAAQETSSRASSARAT